MATLKELFGSVQTKSDWNKIIEWFQKNIDADTIDVRLLVTEDAPNQQQVYYAESNGVEVRHILTQYVSRADMGYQLRGHDLICILPSTMHNKIINEFFNK